MHWDKRGRFLGDVKDCSLLTIAHIAGARETGFYLEALADKRTRKTYPMWAIAVAANEQAVPAVDDFLNTGLRKASRPKPVALGPTALFGFQYLVRVGFDHPGIDSTVALLKKVYG